MRRPFQPLLFILARCSRNQLIRQIEFLKAENEMLRKRVPQQKIVLKADERQRLVLLGQAIGACIGPFLTIVTYQAYMRWMRQLINKQPKKLSGRPRKSQEIRDLILQIAAETNWGYTRILGELRKLGYAAISRQTVVNILKEAGYNPYAPKGPGTWNDLLKRHAETLWQCDFFSKKVISKVGFTHLFSMVLVNVATRRVWVSPGTRNPNATWIKAQVAAFIADADAKGLKVGLVTRDNDRLYRGGFDGAMEREGIRVKHLALRSPNTNPYVERFIQSIQKECLNHFLVFGEKHFDYLVREYVEHYHTERPHQGLENRVIIGPPPPAPPCSGGEIQCRTRLGGLLKHYDRVAA